MTCDMAWHGLMWHGMMWLQPCYLKPPHRSTSMAMELIPMIRKVTNDPDTTIEHGTTFHSNYTPFTIHSTIMDTYQPPNDPYGAVNSRPADKSLPQAAVDGLESPVPAEPPAARAPSEWGHHRQQVEQSGGHEGQGPPSPARCGGWEAQGQGQEVIRRRTTLYIKLKKKHSLQDTPA